MSALQVAAIVVSFALLLVGVALLIRAVARFVKVFTMGAPDPRRTDRPLTRTVTLIREVIGHTRMARLPVVAAAHWVTMISFGLLFLTLVTAFGQVLNASFVLPLIGHFPPFEWLTELFSWGGLIGILYLIYVRQRNHPRTADGDHGRRSRFFGSTFWQAYYVEFTILGVVVCIIALRALEYALASAQGSPTASLLHFPLTAWLGSLFTGASIATLSAWIYVVATAKIVISFAWMITISLTLTMGVAWHRFLAFFNIWFKRHADGRTSLGALQPVYVDGTAITAETLEDVMDSDEGDVEMGVGTVENFTWKGLLDFSTCTECGRCQSQCPAWNTDKPLSPKLLIMALRDHAHAKAPFVLASTPQPEPVGVAAGTALIGATGYDITDPLAAYNPHGPDAVIDEDVLWSCTTCGACVEQCPVDIEHVDSIVDMRRHQVLIESAFPAELGGLFKNMEGKQNPWGMAPKLRLDWAKGLPFEVPVVGQDVEDLAAVDYLFWVGCAGAYEDRAKKTTRAVAELLHTAGVSFAVLGEGEACTGDSARRAGNEILFQMLAAQNVETLNEVGATKIVVTCAHCFNTLKNEYPQNGGEYEVVHHTQLLNRLVRDKRLTPVARPDQANSQDVASTAASVTYHDPCYLGRHNNVYAPPRELIATLPGVELKEMPRHGEKSFCCGAGGARMWMEEKIGGRINRNRTDEAVATGADRIAVGCPFCRVMLSDGLTAAQSEGTARDEVEVVDIAQMLLAAVRRGEQAAPDESLDTDLAAPGLEVSGAPTPTVESPQARAENAAAGAGDASEAAAPETPKKASSMSASQALAAMAAGAGSPAPSGSTDESDSGSAATTPDGVTAPATGTMSASDALAAMQAQAANKTAPTDDTASAPAKGTMSASDALAAMQAQAATKTAPTDDTASAPAKGTMSASDALAAMQAQAATKTAPTDDTASAPPAVEAPSEASASSAPITGKMSASDALAAMMAESATKGTAPSASTPSPAPETDTETGPEVTAGVAQPVQASPTEPASRPTPAADPIPAEPAQPEQPTGTARPAAASAPLTGKMSASDALAAMMAQAGTKTAPAPSSASAATPAPDVDSAAGGVDPEPVQATPQASASAERHDPAQAPARPSEPVAPDAAAAPAAPDAAAAPAAPDAAEAPETPDAPSASQPLESGETREEAAAPAPSEAPTQDTGPTPETREPEATITGKMSATEALKRMRGEL